MTDIERIKELLPKITPGEWRLDGIGVVVFSGEKAVAVAAPTVVVFEREHNAEFIALCRNNIEALIEENERLRKASLSAVSALSWLVAETDGPIRKRAGAVVDEIRIALLPTKEELKRR